MYTAYDTQNQRTVPHIVMNFKFGKHVHRWKSNVFCDRNYQL